MSKSRYVRVYQSILDDPRTASFYDDDAVLASWLRLLLLADLAWPASGQVPRGIKQRALAALIEAGCIEVAGSRYRFHGLDAERGRQSEAGRVGGIASRNARSTRVQRSLHEHANDPATDVEHRSTSPLYSRRESAVPAADAPATDVERDPNDPAEAYFQLVTHWPSPGAIKWLDELAAEFGGLATGNALTAEWLANPVAAGLLSRTKERLAAEAHRAKAEAQRRKAAPANGRAKVTPKEITEADHNRAVLAAELAKVKEMPA